MATVLCPFIARPVAMFAVVVVLPTPPLPDVTTTTFDTCALLGEALVTIKGQLRGPHKFFADVGQKKIERNVNGSQTKLTASGRLDGYDFSSGGAVSLDVQFT